MFLRYINVTNSFLESSISPNLEAFGFLYAWQATLISSCMTLGSQLWASHFLGAALVKHLFPMANGMMRQDGSYSVGCCKIHIRPL